MALWWLMAASCFQFRYTDKKQAKALSKAGVEAEIAISQESSRPIHYTHFNSNSGKPLVVFVHGSPGSSSNFLHYLSDTSLTNYVDVLLVDRPGFGYSDFGDAEPSIQKQATILTEVVQSFNYKRVVLVGHSLGGPIICRMVMDDSTIANGLLIVAGSISAELEPTERWRKPMNKPWLRWILPTSFRVSNQEIIPAYNELVSMEPLWPKIQIPVVILQGAKDRLVPEGNADYGEKVLVNAKVDKRIIKKENHFIPFDHPGMVIDAIKALLTELD